MVSLLIVSRTYTKDKNVYYNTTIIHTIYNMWIAYTVLRCITDSYANNKTNK